MKKRFISAAITMFCGVELVAVLLHAVVFERGFNPSWSISRYMGLEYWSAILFAIANFIVIFFMLKYLLGVRREYKLSVFWLIGVIVMIVAYFGLSCCPLGLFDKAWGEYGTVSSLHHIFSHTLFVSMIVIAVDTLIEVHKGRPFMIYGVLMLVFAAFCSWGYLSGWDFFKANTFFFETGYILANLVFYSLIQ